MPVTIKRKFKPKTIECRSLEVVPLCGYPLRYRCTVCLVEVHPGKSEPCKCGNFQFAKEKK